MGQVGFGIFFVVAGVTTLILYRRVAEWNIVEGERGVITAHRGWSQRSIERLAANYGWEGWPP